ncbi:MAG: response regulator [Oscillospiraceae bacterium]|jgi:putative two-component system response regulator|nr:response regulator [Oscillospiraceae bacterium]
MQEKRKLLVIVDDDITNLVVARNNLSKMYDVFTVPSGKKLFTLLEKVMPDLILLDVNMPVMNGFEILKILKDNEQTAHIPVIFLTAKIDGNSELEGISLGAVDYIAKPFSPPLLIKRVEAHLIAEGQRQELKQLNNDLLERVVNKTRSVMELQNALLHTMAELVECRDDITGGHIARTQAFLRVMIRAMEEKGLHEDEMADWDKNLVIQSAQLHDVGKIAIKDAVLLKPGKLTKEEFDQVKEHTTFGESIIDKIKKDSSEWEFLEYAKIFVATHHEKWDGSGYPRGLAKEFIPLLGRIMAIVDVYDALISERPYKKAFTHNEALDIIKSSSGSHFDPVLIELFLEYEKEFERVSKNV